jgi:hypothetical protein
MGPRKSINVCSFTAALCERKRAQGNRLGECHGKKLVPAGEVTDFVFSVMTFDTAAELLRVDGVEELREIARMRQFLAFILLLKTRKSRQKAKSLTPLRMQIHASKSGFDRCVMCKQPDGSDIAYRCLIFMQPDEFPTNSHLSKVK